MKTIRPQQLKDKFLDSYILRINGDRLFFKCLLFFGSIMLAGIAFFCFWNLNLLS